MSDSPASILYDSGGTEKGTNTNPVRVDPTGTTAQPVTDGGGSLTVDGTVGVSGSVAVTGPLTDTQLRATPVPISDASGSITVDGSISVSNFPSVQPVSDNGGSLTVDGAVTANAGSGNFNQNLVQINGVAIDVDTGVASSGTQRVILANNQSAIPITTTGGEEATYTVIAQGAVVGNNKSMLSIYNPTGSGYVLKLREFYIRNSQTTAVTGVAGNFQLFRFAMGSAPTGGTAVNIIAHDSDDATPPSMDARTGGTVSGEVAAPLDIMRISTDEWGPGTLDVEANQQSIANYFPARSKRDGLLKPFYARAGEGLHMKFATNSTAGSFDIIFVFTKV